MSPVFRPEEEPVMPPDDSCADWLARLHAGGSTAAAEVFHRFTSRLIALARLRLDARLRQKVDPEDVLQSVYKSFFLRQARGELRLPNWQALWSVLALITARKCGRCARRFHAARRNVAAEVAAAGGADDSSLLVVFSADPSPEEAVMLSELVEGLLRALGARDGAILTLALQGHSAAEISAQLGRTTRTVYRVLERIRSHLERRQSEDVNESSPGAV
jgi:RNA polymerase sigma-70 factor (ECF subfamily)